MEEIKNNIGPICVPGSRLSEADDLHEAGEGTYESGGYIYATLAGIVKVMEIPTNKVITLTFQTF